MYNAQIVKEHVRGRRIANVNIQISASRNTSDPTAYGYIWKKGELYDPISKSMLGVLGTIHTHLSILGDASPSSQDASYGAQHTPYKAAGIAKVILLHEIILPSIGRISAQVFLEGSRKSKKKRRDIGSGGKHSYVDETSVASLLSKGG
jgi:hypothetical protein